MSGLFWNMLCVCCKEYSVFSLPGGTAESLLLLILFLQIVDNLISMQLNYILE